MPALILHRLFIADNECNRFQKLKINTVRVYTVDNSADHDSCMQSLANAGIYLALDVNTPKYSINQDSPADSYNAEYLQSIFATIDEFAKYSNTLLFFSGNEDINSVNTTQSAPYVKAVTRDMKQYIGNRKYRSIPVGYSAADVDEVRVATADFFNCGTDDERSDFFAFNDYSWCDPSSFQTSSWQTKVQEFGNYSIPIFLSEYGCTETTRKFEEVATLYSTQMSGVYSGGLVYEYSKEGDATQEKYGLVDLSSGTPSELPDFATLQSAFAGASNPSGNGGARSNGTASTCPTKSSTWLVDSDALPAMPAKASQYFSSGAGKGPGLTGDGSQDAGPGSSGTASAGSGQPTASGTSGSSAASPSSSGKKSAADGRVSDLSFGPMVCGAVVFVSSLAGAMLL